MSYFLFVQDQALRLSLKPVAFFPLILAFCSDTKNLSHDFSGVFPFPNLSLSPYTDPLVSSDFSRVCLGHLLESNLMSYLKNYKFVWNLLVWIPFNHRKSHSLQFLSSWVFTPDLFHWVSSHSELFILWILLPLKSLSHSLALNWSSLSFSRSSWAKTPLLYLCHPYSSLSLFWV